MCVIVLEMNLVSHLLLLCVYIVLLLGPTVCSASDDVTAGLYAIWQRGEAAFRAGEFESAATLSKQRECGDTSPAETWP